MTKFITCSMIAVVAFMAYSFDLDAYRARKKAELQSYMQSQEYKAEKAAFILSLEK